VLTHYCWFIIVIITNFFDPDTQFPVNEKNYAMQYKKVQKSSWNEPYSSSSFGVIIINNVIINRHCKESGD